MDSYEYYLLYREDRNKFMELFTENNQEILIALSKLYKNERIKEKTDIFFRKLLIFIENDVCSNYLLDDILQQLITLELYEESKHYLVDRDCTLPKLRISRILLDFILTHTCGGTEIQQFCEILVNFVFKESNIRQYATGILYQIMKKNDKYKDFILKAVYNRSMERHDDISTQNLCYFFKQMCQNGLKVENLCFIEKYFEDDSGLGRKRGLFLLKCLLEYKILSEENEENWKKFIAITEALEENQSHLILPSLELLHEMKINETFESFWFKVCTLIISHENCLVKSYGLNYIFGLKDNKLKKHQVLKILEASNATYLYDSKNATFLEEFRNFVGCNSDIVFELLVEINWFSVPFYHVLNCLQNLQIPSDKNYLKEFLLNFENQTDIIPKRIKNIKIRGMVKILYTNLLEKVMRIAEFQQILRIFMNIFFINEHHDCFNDCINLIKREDYDLIFRNEHDYEFLRFLLLKTHAGKSMDEVRETVKQIKNKKLLIEVMCDLSELMDDYEDAPNILVHETIELIWILLTDHKREDLQSTLELLEIGLKASKNQIENETFDHLTEIWTRFNSTYVSNPEFEYCYLKLSNIILKYNSKFDTKFLKKDCFSCEISPTNLLILTSLQALIIQNLFENNLLQDFKNIEVVMENIDLLLDRSSSKYDIFNVYDVIKILTISISKEAIESEVLSKKLKNIFNNFIHASSNIIVLSKTFWKSFIELVWKSIQNSEFSIKWATSMQDIFNNMKNNLNENDKISFLLALYSFMKDFTPPLPRNQIMKYFKNCLEEAIFEVNVMSRDDQIEYALVCDNDEETKQRLKFRLHLAQLLIRLYGDEFSSVVGAKILELSIISRKKIRYYPNSNIHRQKLHHYQPLVFCKSIEEETVNALIYELLWVNNQLNVIYMIEIILSSHYSDIINILNDHGKELNSQALKSIFSIAIMQMKMVKNFKKAEEKLNNIFQNIFPFSMGQNFGVRIYSMLTMFLSYEHIKKLSDYTETTVTTKISEVCKLILESVKQKNCLKYFNALRNDFRFTKDHKDLTTHQIFYHDIPKVTKMSFEEIITNEVDDNSYELFAADIFKEIDCTVMTDEMELLSDKPNTNGITNLQQKYLPLKNQIPGENLLRTLPERFKIYDEIEACLKPKSDLIVVASLIDNNTNLGGLARTCEIFGISKYVIHSLKSQENFEFKSLSRTSEKWIHITEIKNWQLFDYLVTMKQSGYIIAGAEQSGSSVSLLNVKIPKKCVLLLGNEKKGIPADLLGLLDLVIEIPQTGVVRSLNVHVAGAILIWEYAKQHTFN